MVRALARRGWIHLGIAAGCLLGASACGNIDSTDSRLQLRFARQAIDSPCPEIASPDAAPPALDALEIALYRPDGSRHHQATIDLGGSKPARLSGIPPAEDLRLQVIGLEGQTPQWSGAARGIDILEGHTASADVFMTRVAEMSCASRPLHYPRAMLAAAEVGAGRILLAGGLSERQIDACGPGCTWWSASPAVDVFDPATGTVFPTVRMHRPRALATATRLPGGGVLVVGGASRVRTLQGSTTLFEVDPQDLVDTFEVYLPDENLWIEKPLPNRSGRVFHTATSLPDGRVLIVGGGTSLADARDDAWLFDPAGESIGDMQVVNDRMATPRIGHAAVLVGEHVLILGGALLPTKSPVEEFSASADGGTFSEALVAGSAINPFFHDAILLPLRPDEILIAGGSLFDGAGQLLVPSEDNVRIYSVSRGEFSDTGHLQIPRLFPRMVALGDDTVLVAGGYQDLNLSPSDQVEVFNPAGSFQTEASLSTPRGGQAVVSIEGGRGLIVGGQGPDGLLGSAEVYTPAP